MHMKKIFVAVNSIETNKFQDTNFKRDIKSLSN